MRFAGRAVRNSEFLRGVMIIGLGSVVAQLLPVLLTPFITRIYSPHDVGMLGLYTSFIGFASGALALGYPQAIVSAQDNKEAAQLLVLSGILILPSTVLASSLLWALHHFSLLGFGELPLMAVLAMALSLLLTGAYLSLRFWLVRLEHYSDISKSTVAQSVGRILTQLVMGLVSGAWYGLVLGELVGRASGLGRMWTRTRNELRVLMHSLSPSDLLNTARRYKKFPIFSTPATLLDSLGPALHVPLITGIFGVSSAGQYSIANQVLVIPAVFIGASVADVFHSRIARLARETPERAPRLFYAVASGLFVVGVAPSAVLYFYGEPLFAAILGEQWRISGVVASALAPRIVSLLVVSPLSRVVMVYQGQELKLVYNALTVLGVILTYHFASKYHWNFVDTMARYTAVQVTLHTVYFVILAFTVHRGTRDLSKMTSA